MLPFQKNLFVIAALAVLAVAGPLAPEAAAQNNQNNAVQEAVDSLKAGGNTIAGPGVYARQANIPDFVIQLTDPSDVCGTITLVSGASVQLNLRDSGGSNIQGVIATPNLRTVAGCANGIKDVELVCTGGQPCRAVWRIDNR